MTTITLSAPAETTLQLQQTIAPSPASRAPEAGIQPAGEHRDAQRLGRLTGLFFLITYATSIPPVAVNYVPALSDTAFVLGGGFDSGISWGALLELLLIGANIATALTLYPVLRKRFPVLSLGYVTARLTESGFIAVGIVALLALNSLRLETVGADPAALTLVGQGLVAVHDWTFRLGPGVIVGVGNGLILGLMMWKTRLVPRSLSILGVVGGPALLAGGVAVIFGQIEAGSQTQMLLALPEFLWELGLGLWLLTKGFNRPALARLLA